MAVINYKAVRRSLKSLRSQVGSALVGFIQSGVGAVKRWVQDKLREEVSVKDFGAVADGTTDDGPAFQLAIDSGFVVKVPAGTYKIDTPVTLPTQSRIYGAGIERTIINSNIVGDSLFKFASGGVSFAHISHMTLRGNGLRGASGSGHCLNCISPNPGSGSLTPQICGFEFLQIEDFLGTDDADETGVGKIASAGIMQYSTIANTARKVYISDCGNGIVMRKTQNCLIDDCVVIECDKAGIYAHDNDRLIIDGCDILKCGEGVSYSSVTISNASPGVVTWTGHGLSNGDLIDLSTTGSLPTGLAINTTYYVVNAATDTFELSATSGGSSINTSSSGSGTHYAMSGADKGYPTPDAQLIGDIVSYANNALQINRTKVKGFRGKAAMVFKGDGYGITVGPSNWLRGDAQIDMPHKCIYASRISGLNIKDNLFFPSNTGFSATRKYESIEIYTDSTTLLSDATIQGNTFTEASGFGVAYNIKVGGNGSTRVHRVTIGENKFGSNSGRSSATTVDTDVLIDNCALEEGSYLGRNSHIAAGNVTRTTCYNLSSAVNRGKVDPSAFNAVGGTITAEYTGMTESVLTGSKTHDWADLATATQQSTTVTVTGAAMGDFVESVSLSTALSGTRLWGEVTAADTVTVYHRNDTGGNVNPTSGTLRVVVRKA